MNPIVIKELRQAVRSRFVTGGLLLFLLVALVATAIVLATHTVDAQTNPGAIFEVGKALFHTIFVILAVVCVLFVPGYTGLRLGAERWGDQLDLQFVATIKPGAIVRGKLLAGGAITGLMVAAAAPFLLLATALRGIDAASALVSLVMLLAIAGLLLQGVILLALLPLSRVFRILMALMLINALFGVFGFTISGVFEVVRSGVDVRDPEFLGDAALFVGAMVVPAVMLHTFAVFCLSPPSANRALPLRLTLTYLWLLWGLVLAGLAWVRHDPELLLAWFIPAMVLASAGVLAAVGGAPDYSRRVHPAIPRSWPRRLLCLPFYNGFAGALLWSAGIGLATLTSFAALPATALTDLGRTRDAMAHVFAYSLAYALTARLLWRLFVHRWVPVRWAWVVAVMLLAIGAALPLLVGLMTNRITASDVGAWQLGNPFAALADDHHRAPHLLFAGLWALAAALLNAPALAEGWHRFHPDRDGTLSART